jgi:hypothetical protein
VSSRAEVFLTYLDYFRSRLVGKLEALPGDELRRSRLHSGWAPIELLKHLSYVELRWLEGGLRGPRRRRPVGRRPGRPLVRGGRRDARHVGHLDIVSELAGGQTGE